MPYNMNLDKFIDKLDEKWKEFFIENRNKVEQLRGNFGNLGRTERKVLRK